MSTAAFITGATLGLFNLPHCAGMCGPLASASCGHERKTGPLRYQFGRTCSYVAAGAIAGHVGEGVAFVAPGRLGAWLFAGLSALACLLTARSLLWSGQRLFTLRTSKNARSPLTALLRLVPRDPLLLGLASVLLPCGLLAAALVAAVTTGRGNAGALLMLGFVTSSGISLLSVAWLMQLVPAQASLGVRRGLAMLLVVTAVLVIARPLRSESNASSSTDHLTHHCH
jgi:sulfite exporter TauE/SafE